MRKLLPVLALVGCTTSTTITSPRCDLTVGTPSPTEAAAGTTVTLSATPMTSTWDTAVYVGGMRATVLEVTRDNCDTCDTCRSDAGCTSCGDCDVCDLECSQDCSESVSFDLPLGLPAGANPVWVYNEHGTGGPADVTILSAPDTGTKDTGTKDTGAHDTGTKDTGTKDTGTKDTAGAGDTAGTGDTATTP